MSQRDDFMNAQLACVGMAYSTGPSRCTGQHGYFDCSGLQCYALNRCGIPYPCSNSFAMAQACRDAHRPDWMIAQFGPGQGTLITREQAIRTKGAWAFHGPNHGYSPSGWNGSGGHIKASMGDGSSVEAHSHATGVIRGYFDDYKCTNWALPPGMTGFVPSVERSDGNVMGMTAAMIVPKSHALQAGPLKGRYPFVGMVLQPNGQTDMVGYNGAKLPGGVDFVGLSIKHMGHLNSPAVSCSSPDGKSIVFLASDGGTFQVFPTVKYPRK